MGFFDKLFGKPATAAHSCPHCAERDRRYGEYWRYKTPLTVCTHCDCAPTNGHQCTVKSHYDVYECTTARKKDKPKERFSLFPKSDSTAQSKRPVVKHHHHHHHSEQPARKPAKTVVKHHHYYDEQPTTSYTVTFPPSPPPGPSPDNKVYIYTPGNWRITNVHS